ncbi:lineage-specific thermal regulator protein [Virgibacillus profundi]|uniref:Lineage-specific thermal regulator protein n=1 Tax=Virgibacillus profundi TaxID=2024555 RepID=A0A2A2ICU5_9BACI|nr:PadR family transcriptional regulator [Virgibacillus profundi]PAV29136.1 lineage-specific thermal regulator protein [Virgibacillus profundi]PXY53305.1 lineage-specific thermal regulator protein [Virgibacillus profundi]
MENKLRGLRETMDKKRFSQLNFSDQIRLQVHEKIRNQNNKEENILVVLQLLIKEKTGFDLTQQLNFKCNHSFEENEGELYTLLHALEQNGYLISKWNESEAKLYQTSAKGKKAIQKAGNQERQKGFLFKELLEG